jgi:hypothetical protein
MAMVLCAGACAGAARAQTELYIAEYKFNDAQFSAVETDGSNPRTLFALPAALWLPIGTEYDPQSGRLLWMDAAGTSELFSANLDGTGRALVTAVPGFARAPSRDALGRIYFSTGQTIQRVEPSGTGLTTIFTGNVSGFPAGDPIVDATNGHVYVGYYGEILRMNLDGTNLKSLFTGGSTVRAIALDVASRHLYWIDSNTNSDFLARINLDGSGFELLHDVSPFMGQSSGLISLVVDAPNNAIYFADELVDVVYRCELDGTNVVPIFASVSDRSPSGLTLSTGAPVQALNDCDGNGIADDIDIANGAPDCDNNGVPDACQAVACPDWVVLLDQGSNAIASGGRALGAPSQWQVFQPFDVPPGGWSIGTIGLDGFTSVDAGRTGFTVRLFADNGTGTRPDESVTLAIAVGGNYHFNTNLENWTYVPLSATLGPGRYWLRLEANDTTFYAASVNLGFSGLQSLSRGVSGNFTAPASPIALRIIQADEACAADYNADGISDILDLLDFLEDFSSCEQQPAPCGTFGDSDLNGDTTVDVLDLLDFLQAFSEGC